MAFALDFVLLAGILALGWIWGFMDRFWVFRLGNGPQGRDLGLKIQGGRWTEKEEFPHVRKHVISCFGAAAQKV